MKKEDLDADPQSMDNRRLGAIARNPNHPQATHAKAELARRKVKKAEMGEGAMKRIATTQSNKADRIASGGKKGLETFKKKPVPEGTTSMRNLKLIDKIKKSSAVKSGSMANESKVNEVSSNTLSNYMRKSTASAGKPRQDTRTMDKRIGGQKMADDKLRKMDGKGSAAKVAATEADDATVRMYKDNPDMMKSKGPGGLKSLSKKAQKDVKKSMNEAATPAMKKAADELNLYAKKHGGIDKADFMKTAKMLSTGKAGMSLIKFVDGQDTDVYEKILTVMAKHMGKQTIEKMFKVKVREEVEQIDELTAAEKKLVNQMYDKKGNLTPMGKKVMIHGKKPGDKGYVENTNEEVESVNELSKDTMQSYWDKTKGDDAFSGSRKANNRLKGAINVTTKLDRLKKMIKKK